MNQKQMDAIRAKDDRFNAGKEHGKEGLVYSVDRRALMASVRNEGPEILTDKGRDWWREQEDLYDLRKNGKKHFGESRDGHFGRHGRISKTYRGGKWYAWKNGAWQEEEQ